MHAELFWQAATSVLQVLIVAQLVHSSQVDWLSHPVPPDADEDVVLPVEPVPVLVPVLVVVLEDVGPITRQPATAKENAPRAANATRIAFS